jgi:peptidoglycan hydrolase-like protein with peptidoglycan-binding domain
MNYLREFCDFLNSQGPNANATDQLEAIGQAGDLQSNDRPQPADQPQPDDPALPAGMGDPQLDDPRPDDPAPSTDMVSLRIDPPAAGMEPTTSMQFRAMGTPADGPEQDITSSVSWDCNDRFTIVFDAPGLARACGSESKSVRIVASITRADGGTVSGMADIDVTPNDGPPSNVSYVEIDPPAARMDPGTSMQFQALVVYVGGSKKDMTSTVKWKSDNDDVVTVDDQGEAFANSPQAQPVGIRAEFWGPDSYTAFADITVTAAGPQQQNPNNPIVPNPTVNPNNPVVPNPQVNPPQSARSPTLRKGDTSADGWVEYLQELLALPPTGTFDDATEAAVKKYQADNQLLVDGIVGNQTWACLRHDNPEQPGTDGRAPGTFVDNGQKARWYTVDEPFFCVASQDVGKLSAVSVGDADLEGGGGTVTVTRKDGNRTTNRFTIGKPAQRTPDDQGDLYWVELKNFSQTFNFDPAEVEQCKIELMFDAELGGDYWTS